MGEGKGVWIKAGTCGVCGLRVKLTNTDGVLGYHRSKRVSCTNAGQAAKPGTVKREWRANNGK